MSHFNPVALTDYLRAIEKEDIVTVPHFLGDDSRQGLLQELKSCHFSLEPEEKGPYSVQQRFSSVTTFPTGSRFYSVRFALERVLNAACENAGVTLNGYLRFTDMVVQRYAPGPIGVSLHRDGDSFINLVAIFILEGNGTFHRYSNRDGADPREVRNEPGDLLLMGGPGFLGSDIQPFHSLDNIEATRTSFSLRQKRKKS